MLILKLRRRFKFIELHFVFLFFKTKIDYFIFRNVGGGERKSKNSPCRQHFDIGYQGSHLQHVQLSRKNSGFEGWFIIPNLHIFRLKISIKNLFFQVYPSEGNITANTLLKTAFIKFDDERCVEVAQHLTNTVVIDCAIVCLPYPNREFFESCIFS